FVSADNMVYTTFNRSDWEYSKNNGVITLTFKQAIKLRYLKIHVKIDDRDQLFQPVDKATFLNELAKTVQVYQEVTGRTEEYQYDAAGNRMLLKVTLSQTNQYNSRYYPNSDRLMTDGKYAFAYDAAGNLIQKGNKFTISGNTVSFTTKGTGVEYWEYSYDLLNRLIKVTKNGTIASEYQYDPTGLRVVKKAKGQTTHYVFEGTEPIFEKNITTNKVKSYIYAFGKHLARVDGKIGDSSAKKYFYHTDQLGSVKAITDQNGQIVKKNDYYAFGSQFNQEGSLDETHGFTGKEYDADIDLYYYNARWYDPELGRFISEDPARDPNNPNLYSYCGNNPTCRIDSDGQIWWLVGAALGALNAALNGGDSTDIFCGALIGLVSAGVGTAVSAVVGTIGSGLWGTVITGAVTGGLTGGIMSALTGGDFWDGFTTGVLSGAVAAYLNTQFRDFARKGWFCAGIRRGAFGYVNSLISGGGTLQDFAYGFIDGVADYGRQSYEASKQRNSVSSIDIENFGRDTLREAQIELEWQRALIELGIYVDAVVYELDPERLYEIEKEVYYDPQYNKDSKGTYCNRYAEKVFRLYTGSSELLRKDGLAKNCYEIYKTVSASNNWNQVSDGLKAQQLANKGYFVIAISTKAENPSTIFEHVAVIAPGLSTKEVVKRYGYYCPAIAQQGRTKILYGVDKYGTMNYGWRLQDNPSITFWSYNP
ncbi:MAG TPA: RHS repeat-associated core domain-containing protein, partial [Bacillota bacterium]